MMGLSPGFCLKLFKASAVMGSGLATPRFNAITYRAASTPKVLETIRPVFGSDDANSLFKVVQGQSTNTVEVPPALVLPEIDGKYTPISKLELSELGKELVKKDPNLMSMLKDEWSYDALEIELLLNPASADKTAQGKAYLRIKYDMSSIPSPPLPHFFYGVIDYVSKKKIEPGDVANVFFDPKNNRGTAPQLDDFGLVWGWDKTGIKTSAPGFGTGSTWKFCGTCSDLGAKVDCELGVSPSSNEPHEIFEFRVPFNMVKQNDIISSYATVGNYVKDYWFSYPQNGRYKIPDTWGYLSFSTNPIPGLIRPFDIAALSVLTTLSTLALFKRYSKKGKYLL